MKSLRLLVVVPTALILLVAADRVKTEPAIDRCLDQGGRWHAAAVYEGRQGGHCAR
jgi:hypothetical protein